MPLKSNFSKKFSTKQRDDFFATILVNDVVDLEAQLPEKIHLDYEQTQLIDCFQLCFQLWEAGFDRKNFGLMVKKLYQQRDLSPEDRVFFKHVRAKFKQLRFAFALYDKKHGYPKQFNHITVLMGRLQDVFKNGQRREVGFYAFLLRVFLTRFPMSFIDREMNLFSPDSIVGFRSYVTGRINFIRDRLEQTEITGKEFHRLRKAISGQVSFYAALTVLSPSQYHNDIFRYLGSINGMMGSMHDDLIEQEITGESNYHSSGFKIPDEIKQRLTAVVDSYSQLNSGVSTQS